MQKLPTAGDGTMADCADEQERCRIGDRVRIRRERWLVAAVDGATACRLLTLAGLGPHNFREQRRLLEPFEDIEPIAASTARSAPGEPNNPFMPPARVWRCGRRRWRAACRSVLIDSGPWDALHTADTAHIDVLPHQLDPVRAVLRGEATRVLLADAVGLGKTVQAGLLAAELIQRGAVESVLILTPAGLRDQWQHELRRRFSLEAEVVDVRSVAQRAADLPIGVSPWATLGLAIASVDYIKRLEVLPAASSRLWDLVIVDEAHLVSPGTDRYAAVSALCATALFVVLLTATPHSGDRTAYAALCALGERNDACLAFRRTRADVHLQTARRVHQLRVRPSGAEQRLHTALDRYCAAVRAECGEAQEAALLVSILWKRALSSAESLRRSVVRRLRVLDRTAPFDDTQLRLPLDDGSGEFDIGDEAPGLDGPALIDVGRERHLLERLARAAIDVGANESKLARLRRLLARLQCRREAVIVFTEYRDTLVHVQQSVAPDALVLHGGLTRHERRAVVDAFTTGTAHVLLATDAAGEGLNLHNTCRCVVHLELPWNPVRLEQRTGRVDRIGQQRTVHAFHLVCRHRVEDDLLRRLQARVAAAQQDVDMISPFESQPRPSQPAAPRESTHVDGRHRSPLPDNATLTEVTRIGRARAIGRRCGPGVNDGAGQCLVIGARRRVRAWLAGGTLVIAEVVTVDALGRRVATATVAMRITAHTWQAWRCPSNHTTATPVAGAAARAIAAVVEFNCGSGAASRAAHTDFWTTAARRAEAIAQAATPTSSTLFQPGLFDRGVQRRREALDIEQHALADATARRAERLAAATGEMSAVVGRWLALVS